MLCLVRRSLLPGTWPCSESFVQGLASGGSWGLPGHSVLLCAAVTVKDATGF